ncbi:Hypothetical protein HDN1F_18070 [gamma proteobacterium HdN1]|nr:Hypothetical protein HDN1F_18070 [gamma proteobacterium HdN1]
MRVIPTLQRAYFVRLPRRQKCRSRYAGNQRYKQHYDSRKTFHRPRIYESVLRDTQGRRGQELCSRCRQGKQGYEQNSESGMVIEAIQWAPQQPQPK